VTTSGTATRGAHTPPTNATAHSHNGTAARSISRKTRVVKNNGFNPVWQEKFSLPFDCVGDMQDLIFVKFAVRQEDGDDGEPLAVYCASLGSLQHGEWFEFHSRYLID
jgi:phosphatidylinositol phospholipase C delta